MEAIKEKYLFSIERRESIEIEFEKLVNRLGNIKNEIIDGLENCTEDEKVAMKFLYTSMPISDISDYSFDIFYEYVKHGLFLREESLFSKDLDEDMFLNYVMHHRVNNEDINDCRSFFYDQIKDIIKDKNVEDAIKAINYWCASQVTYQATDDRTISPMGAYKSAFGRCGEESTFTVSVLRSAGIPAKQVYSPRWSHCDDNHAWVEVYFDNKWHFLGACEPEEILNVGWFTSASSRAMMIHSRYFDYKVPNEETVGYEGMATVVNNLSTYAYAKNLKLIISDENGNRLPNVKVNFEVINYSEYFPIASLISDENGEVEITLGLGSIHIHANKDDLFIDEVINIKNINEEVITLKLEKNIENDIWQDMDLIAPQESAINSKKPNKEVKAFGKSKLKQEIEKRLQKVENFYNEDLANEIVKNFDGKEELKEILKLSRGNFDEIKDFLLSEVSKEEECYKIELLKVLSIKDYRDLKCNVLLSHLKNAIKFENKYEKDIFVNYILNPRVHLETLTCYREYINEHFTKEQIDNFNENPKEILDFINSNIKEIEEYEYKGILSTPVGALKVNVANYTSKKILFVAICRSLGIPAKINKIDKSIEYYDGCEFVTVENKKDKNATLKISSNEKNTDWVYFSNWSIAKLNNGVYETLDLMDISFKDNITLNLEEGDYRVITSNRLPNGNIFANKLCFSINKNEEKEISLQLRKAEIADMLEEVELYDFELLNENNESMLASKIINKDKSVFIWLAESEEPTEHILNEIYDRKEEFNEFTEQINLIVKNKNALNDPTLSRTYKELKDINIYYDDFDENPNVLARAMFEEPEKLPLIIVVNNKLQGMYSNTGYNVGTGEMLLRILKG